MVNYSENGIPLASYQARQLIIVSCLLAVSVSFYAGKSVSSDLYVDGRMVGDVRLGVYGAGDTAIFHTFPYLGHGFIVLATLLQIVLFFISTSHWCGVNKERNGNSVISQLGSLCLEVFQPLLNSKPRKVSEQMKMKFFLKLEAIAKLGQNIRGLESIYLSFCKKEHRQ